MSVEQHGCFVFVLLVVLVVVVLVLLVIVLVSILAVNKKTKTQKQQTISIIIGMYYIYWGMHTTQWGLPIGIPRTGAEIEVIHEQGNLTVIPAASVAAG